VSGRRGIRFGGARAMAANAIWQTELGFVLKRRRGGAGRHRMRASEAEFTPKTGSQEIFYKFGNKFLVKYFKVE